MSTVIRSSKLARYMVCAGYMHLDVEETPGGEAAREGTACGEYFQDILEGNQPRKMASNGVYIDDDMKFYTEPLSVNIHRRAKSAVLCETRIDWQTRSGIWMKGQYDAAFIDQEDALCIEDLKYGYGIVDVKENWQLLSYAIGEVMRQGRYFEKIKLTIHQPRPHHEDGPSRTWVLSYEELLQYKEKIEARLDLLAAGLKNFQTSSQCKYCKGAAEACTAFNELFYRSIEVSREFQQDSLSNDEVAAQLDLIKRAEEVIKIKHDSLTELGTLRIKAGGIIPGYIQVEKYTQRNWKAGISPDAIKMMTGVDVRETSFMSPAKAEKCGVSKDLVKQLSKMHVSGWRLEKRNATELGNKIFGTHNPQGGSIG